MKRALMTLAFFLSFAASAADGWTPAHLRDEANLSVSDSPTEYALATGYFVGATMAFETMQNLKFLGHDICMPVKSLEHFRDAVNSWDPSGYADTNEGGIVYLWFALRAKYPC